MNSSNLLALKALAYARAGYSIFPCKPQGKEPLTPKGHKDATVDEKMIQEWWEKWPNANIGLALEPSGLMVIDLDRHPGQPDGVEAFTELKDKRPYLEKPPLSKTGGNGNHLIFKRPSGRIKGKPAASIDVKINGYIIVPPSLHPNGTAYQWEPGRSLLEMDEPVNAPDWLLSFVVQEETDLNTSSQLAGEMEQYPASSGEKVIQHCAFMKHVTQNAQSLTEPEWYHGIGVLAYTEEAPEIVHKYSNSYHGYSPDETDKKIAHWKRDGHGPSTCQAIQEKCGTDHCTGCPFKGAIKSPIILGYAGRQVEKSGEREAFPVDILPGVFGGFARSASVALQCPVDYIACSLLAAVSILIGSKRRIQLEPEWGQLANLWIVLVGTPSAKKSPALDKAFTTLRNIEKGLYSDYLQRKNAYEVSVERYKLDLRDWKEIPTGDPPLKPEEPTLDRLTSSDTTVEALGEMLAANHNGIALVCDELSSWIRSMNQYKNGRGSDRSHYLSMWSNAQMTIDRKGKAPIIVPTPYLVLIGGIQPDVLLEMSNQGVEDGLKERLLFTCPLPNTDMPVIGSEIPQTVWVSLENCLRWIFSERPLDEAITIGLSEGAQAAFLEARQEWHNTTHSEAFISEMEAYYVKMHNYLGRFALILHEMERSISERDKEPVSEATMKNAKMLADYFLSHAHVALRMVKQTQEEQRIEKTAQWIRKKGLKVVCPRDLQTGKVAGCRKTSQAKEILQLLQDYGYGYWNPDTDRLIFLGD